MPLPWLSHHFAQGPNHGNISKGITLASLNELGSPKAWKNVDLNSHTEVLTLCDEYGRGTCPSTPPKKEILFPDNPKVKYNERQIDHEVRDVSCKNQSQVEQPQWKSEFINVYFSTYNIIKKLSINSTIKIEKTAGINNSTSSRMIYSVYSGRKLGRQQYSTR